MDNFPLKKETYEIIGVCMEVQRVLGYGFSEVIYKDALEVEFTSNDFLYRREHELTVTYKEKQLQHRFFADFICFDQVILEIKSSEKGIANDHISQTLNYLRVSGHTVGLIINFGKRRLEYKRLVSGGGSQ